MAIQFHHLSVADVWRTCWMFLCVLSVGIGIRIWFRVWWWPHETAYALADAAIVAGVIGIVLELSAAKFLIERVSDELAEKLVGRGLPSELQAEIKHIVDTDLVRENYVKSYRFSDAADDKVQIEATISYDVRNYSDGAREYAPFVEEEVFYEPEFVSVEYGVGRVVCYRQKEIAARIESDPNTNVKSFRAPRKVRIQPIRRDNKAVCRVRIAYRVRMPEEYTDIICFGGPTIGATLTVDRIPQGYEICSGSAESIRHDPNGNSWYYDRPFIAGQHIRLWWFKRPVSESS
jgi:hypothetical protein